jgi:plasmid stabilization system protein ParE
MRFELRNSLRAEEDVDAATAWMIKHRSAEYASDWLDQLHEAYESLQSDPTRHPSADEAADIERPLQELHIGKRSSGYRIIFEVHDRVIHILRVRHSARDALTDDDLARGLSD